MAGLPNTYTYGDPLDPRVRGAGTSKTARTWLVKDSTGERLEISADEVSSSVTTLTFALQGQVVACINGWQWYRVHPSDLPKT